MEEYGQVLVINGHDYSHYVQSSGGLTWKLNAVDSKATQRVVGNAKMRRDKIADKRTISWKMLPMPEDLFRQLVTDTRSVFYTATIRDLFGIDTITAYTSSISGTLVLEQKNRIWNNISFEMIEQ